MSIPEYQVAVVGPRTSLKNVALSRRQNSRLRGSLVILLAKGGGGGGEKLFGAEKESEPTKLPYPPLRA